MTIKADSSGLFELANDIAQLRLGMNARAGHALDTYSALIAERMEDSILHDPKTGRMYGTHQSSAPGEAPANWSGELARSIYIDRKGSNQYVTRREVGASAPHATVLEFGGITDSHNYIAPRPFVAPAYDLYYEDMITAVADEIMAGF